VDRFQQDDGVRVFVANIVAGGVGINLTAARQVVFNDLDWVPANHWQAEDRAYRIGQTNTVHVTYICAEDTVDEFVAALLRIKEDIIGAVTDGGALQDGSGNVLEELQRLLHAMSPELADHGGGRMEPAAVASLMRQLRHEVEAKEPATAEACGPAGRRTERARCARRCGCSSRRWPVRRSHATARPAARGPARSTSWRWTPAAM
jgi:hypothetical protein